MGQLTRILQTGRALTYSPIIVTIARAGPEDIWRCLELGANDFLSQPWRPLDIVPRSWRMVAGAARPSATHAVDQKSDLAEFIGSNARFRSELDRVVQVSGLGVSVLVQGESGTGKELVAQAIHRLSPRASKPFVAVNCGAIPNELIENELFGHERGAYTGAATSQGGLIEQAEGGTIFLDEIGCLPLPAQVKLLRFLQNHEVRRLGSGHDRTTNVRVIAATNIDLEDAVRGKTFRADLYYRLNVIPISLPPLRDRREDIPLLANHFLRKYAAAFARPVASLEPDARWKLVNYDWPGNIRELENAMQRTVALARETQLRAGDILLPRIPRAIPETFQQKKALVIEQFEKAHIEELLAAHGGNISQAAVAAQKNRRAFWQLIRKHKIDASRFKLAPMISREDKVGLR